MDLIVMCVFGGLAIAFIATVFAKSSAYEKQRIDKKKTTIYF